jgi:hypothetical protein
MDHGHTIQIAVLWGFSYRGDAMRLARPFLVALALSAAVAGTTFAAPSDPFKGKWQSVDTDGSNQLLALGGAGSTRQVTLHDDFASACGGGVAVVRGIGTVAGDSLSGTFAVRCANGTAVPDTPVTWEYDSETDTLTDSFGVVWSR